MNSLKSCRALLTAGALACVSSLAIGQQPLPIEKASDLSHIDHHFLEKASKAGLEEVAISQAVADRTSNAQVREFAQMIVNDHTLSNNTLAGIASAKKVNIPPAETAADKWTKKNSSDYDINYLKKMISDHEDAIKLFTKEADDGKDTDAVGFARQNLPTLQEHLEKAKDLLRTIK